LKYNFQPPSESVKSNFMTSCNVYIMSERKVRV